MSWLSLKFPVYFLFLAWATVLGCSRWKQLQKADRILAVLMVLTVLQELAAYVCLKVLRNNMFTYHFYSPAEFFLICYYFNERNSLLRKKNIGLGLGIAGIAISIANTVFFQPLEVFNSYYLLFEGALIIMLCLLNLYEILLDDKADFRYQSFFWITLALFLYESVTFTGWGMFSFADFIRSPFLRVLEFVLYISNLLLYLVISLVFVNHKKLSPSVVA